MSEVLQSNRMRTSRMILGRILIIGSIQVFLTAYSFISLEVLNPEDLNVITIVNIFALMSCTVVLGMYFKSGNSTSINVIMTAFDTSYIAFILFMTGKNASPFVPLLPLYILFTSIIFKKNGALISTIFSVLIVLTNYLLTPPLAYELNYMITIACVLILFGIVSSYFVERDLKSSINLYDLGKMSKLITESMKLGIIAVNKERQIESINKKAEKILGDKKTIYSLLNKLSKSGETAPYKLELGPSSFIFVYKISLISGYILVVKDISKDEHIDKLKLIGSIAAVLAHEIKNPISSIAGVSELIRSDKNVLSNKTQKEKLLGIIERESERLSSLAEEFLIYSGSEKRREESVKISNIIKSSCDNIRMNKDFVRKRLELELICPENINCSITGDGQRISQAIENILINSVYSCPENCQITCIAACDEDEVNIVISDSGPGIPEDIRDSIFDPFFTTREKGTGLGLSIAKNIILAHKGSINLEESGKNGATFKIRLPRS